MQINMTVPRKEWNQFRLLIPHGQLITHLLRQLLAGKIAVPLVVVPAIPDSDNHSD
jgi:hypothetical protein